MAQSLGKHFILRSRGHLSQDFEFADKGIPKNALKSQSQVWNSRLLSYHCYFQDSYIRQKLSLRQNKTYLCMQVCFWHIFFCEIKVILKKKEKKSHNNFYFSLKIDITEINKNTYLKWQSLKNSNHGKIVYATQCEKIRNSRSLKKYFVKSTL